MPSRVFQLIGRHIVIDTWVFAGLCVWRAITTAKNLSKVPDLLDDVWDRQPAGNPTLVVIVPARNEEATLEPALRTLIAQDYSQLRIVAVDDRSEDATGAVMERLAIAHPERLSVIHIQDLPAGWLGKTHAMAFAARQVLRELAPDFLLFTDADIHFQSDALRRSLAAAVQQRADHLVTMPTPVTRGPGEAVFLGLFQVLGLCAVRLWRVADPRSIRDSIGVGAFALLRSSAYRRIGGFEALRMEILEDLYLGRRVKALGLRQRVVLGRGLVRVHWAPGALGVVGVLTKNLFALFRFRLWLILFVAFWLAAFSIGPILALLTPVTLVPAVLIVASVVLMYRLAQQFSGLPLWTCLFAPAAGLLLVYSMIRSAAITLWQGGVRWRGTFYSLRQLRSHAGPLFPRKQDARTPALQDAEHS